ncbi:sugar transferase [Pseudoruegeria sp. SHC-113]|uniref:sugar transferase n=1 Tax=Pseudoruegeria sp. SHC-113 TaxID=2855439 RepID=UPI0021BA698C|nr:sugar transferase [Pseudoruegeria sp. SHC-113]MCT8158639.1 sugar transferase [Pseudoruegeria sp. SHC-113]
MSFQDWNEEQLRGGAGLDIVVAWDFEQYNRFGKRILDLCVVLLVTPFIVPVILVSACLIGLDGSNPFYVQERVGRGNRIFRMWKLRTMVPDAKRRLEEVLERDPDARTEWDSTQKLKCDPRTTSLGRFIRRFSIDELPQIWNVVLGDMSVVGPRPMMPEQRSLYPGKAYFSLRPGMTGLWQVSDRNKTTFAARSDYDLAYANDLSITQDLLIILRTARVVLKGTGY